MRKNLLLKAIYLVLILIGSKTLLFSQNLVNPNATKETIALKHFLDSIYGKKMISGQAYESVSEKWNEYIFETTGKKPALLSLDFMNSMPYRVSQGSKIDTTTKLGIDWVKKQGGILEMHWHWDAPKDVTGDLYQAFYTKNTSFDVSIAVNDVNSKEHELILRDMDTVAGLLLKMQEAGVPVLWRPVHEAEGTWFWWGAKGKDACIKLWNLMYDRFTNFHHLNNLIWVWNSYGSDKGNWYPGDATVDIIAWDYDGGSAWSQYQQLFKNNGKLFALGEEGKVPNPSNFSTNPWLYFNTWAYMIKDPSLQNGKNTKDWLKKVFNDPSVLTLDDLIPGPKAYAGSSITLVDMDGNGKETAQLDGSISTANSSSDVIETFEWIENKVVIGTGAKPSIDFNIGTHSIQLKITTKKGLTKTAEVNVTVKKKSLGLNKTVKASSSETGSTNFAAKAVDGDSETRWSSTYSDPQYLEVDLGANFNIHEINIDWEVASAKNFTVEVSNDDTNWSVVKTNINMAAGARKDVFTLTDVSGRFVKINGTARNSEWGFSIYELEIFGTEKPTELINLYGQTIDFEVYPTLLNSNSILFLKSQELLNNAVVSIYDLHGKTVYKEALTSTNQNIETSNFGKGIFMMTLNSKEGSITKKIIVQ